MAGRRSYCRDYSAMSQERRRTREGKADPDSLVSSSQAEAPPYIRLRSFVGRMTAGGPRGCQIVSSSPHIAHITYRKEHAKADFNDFGCLATIYPNVSFTISCELQLDHIIDILKRPFNLSARNLYNRGNLQRFLKVPLKRHFGWLIEMLATWRAIVFCTQVAIAKT